MIDPLNELDSLIINQKDEIQIILNKYYIEAIGEFFIQNSLYFILSSKNKI